MAKKNFTVIYPIKHDGEKFKKGDIVSMDADKAQSLVKRGVLVAGKGQPVDTNPGMPDAQKGEPKEPEGKAEVQIDDPATQTAQTTGA